MLNGPAVVSLSHAMLSGYVGFALLHRARSFARRNLAFACLSLATYSLLIGLAYASHPPSRGILRSLSLDTALVAAVFLVRFARSLRQPSLSSDVRPSQFLSCFGIVATIVAFLASSIDIWTELHGRFVATPTSVLLVAILAFLAATIGTLGHEARRGGDASSRAARAYLFATIWPGLILIWGMVRMLGGPMGPYRLARDVSILISLYALIAAYLDHADEPMSLRVRFVAGTLTIVLVIVCAVCELELPTNPEAPIDTLTLVRVNRDSVRLLMLAVVSCFAVILLVPRLYRRSVVVPIDRLVAGMSRLQRGERAIRLATDHNDELGYITESFNRLTESLATAEHGVASYIAELQTRNHEVTKLNEELRQQVAARSRELAQVMLNRVRSSVRELASGDKIDSRYRIEGLLGRGGMGTVYAVRRLHDGCRLALKVVHGTTDQSIERFAREARIASSLNHPNLVSIVDVGVWRDFAYTDMELIEDGSLEEHRDHFGEVAWSYGVLAQLAKALVVLHERGIIHRDLKPANILLARDGDRRLIKVTDFGVAFEETDPWGATSDAESTAMERLTRAGAMVGTWAYMAPEIAQGTHKVSAAADIFAFGLIAYELFNGKPPFDAPAVFLSRTLPPAPALGPMVDPTLAAILAACLEREPSQRPTAQTIADALSLRALS